MKAKRLLKLSMAVALTVGLLTGCSSSKEDVKEVAIVQYVEHTSLDTIKKSFDKEMDKLGYKEGENIDDYVKKLKEFTPKKYSRSEKFLDILRKEI